MIGAHTPPSPLGNPSATEPDRAAVGAGSDGRAGELAVELDADTGVAPCVGEGGVAADHEPLLGGVLGRRGAAYLIDGARWVGGDGECDADDQQSDQGEH